jgi:hypothetical protein
LKSAALRQVPSMCPAVPISHTQARRGGIPAPRGLRCRLLLVGPQGGHD